MEGLAEDRRKSAHQDLGHRLDKTTTSADVGASSRERPLSRLLQEGKKSPQKLVHVQYTKLGHLRAN